MIYELTPWGETVHRTERRSLLDFLPGSLVVNVKADAFLPYIERAAATESLDAFPEKLAAPLRHLRRDTGMADISAVAVPATARPGRSDSAMIETLAASADASDSDELQGLMVVKVKESENIQALARKLTAAGTFDFVEPFPARWPAASVRLRPIAAVDPDRNLQWHLRAIRWFDFEPIDCSDITVAILDSGIDATHVRLKSAIRKYEHYKFSRVDLLGHGTHVAGILGGRRDPSLPMTGVSNCRLAVWKVFKDRPIKGEFYVDPDAYFRALREVEESEARVVNLSLGGTEPTGRHLTLMAPGTNILSTLPNRRSRYRDEVRVGAWNGTSMATPQVAAAVALLTAKRGALAPSKVKELLCKAAAPLEEMTRRDGAVYCGSGLLDLRKLLGPKKKR